MQRLSSRVVKITNIFGSLGYLSMVFQWLWAGVTVALPYLHGVGADGIFMPDTSRIAPTSTPVELPGPVQTIIIVLAIGLTLCLMMYALWTIPRSIGRTGKRVTQTTARVTVAHVKVNHKPLPKKRQRRLFEYITWAVKLIFISIPLIVLVFPTPASVTIDHGIILIVGVILFSWSFAWFALQRIMAKICHLTPEQVW